MTQGGHSIGTLGRRALAGMIVTVKRERLGSWPGLAAGAPMLITDEANRRDSSYADAGGDRALIHNRLKSLRIGGLALSD